MIEEICHLSVIRISLIESFIYYCRSNLSIRSTHYTADSVNAAKSPILCAYLGYGCLGKKFLLLIFQDLYIEIIVCYTTITTFFSVPFSNDFINISAWLQLYFISVKSYIFTACIMVVPMIIIPALNI